MTGDREALVVMGVDPGLTASGYGVVRVRGGRPEVVDFGVVRPGRAKDGSRRLHVLYGKMSELIEKFTPDAFAIEQVFFGKSFKSAMRIGEARAVAILAAAERGVEVFEYEARLVKKAVVGAGGAHKSQVQMMVKTLLGLDEIPAPDDAADALAVALCHCHRIRTGDRFG